MAKLYEQLAPLWPLLSPLEDYAADAERLRALIDQHLCRTDPDKPIDVVEFGAGGGHTLFYLAQDCRCTAVDLSDAMLKNSRRINADVTHIVADMRDAQLGKRFDVVLIHDAIDYLINEQDIAATFKTAAKHLCAGGLLIVAPTYTTESFVDGESMEDENADDDTEVRFVTRVATVPDQPNRMQMRLTLFIRDLATKELTIEKDTHTCGLFSSQTWIDHMQAAGFSVLADTYLEGDESDDQPIPTFIGVRD